MPNAAGANTTTRTRSTTSCTAPPILKPYRRHGQGPGNKYRNPKGRARPDAARATRGLYPLSHREWSQGDSLEAKTRMAWSTNARIPAPSSVGNHRNRRRRAGRKPPNHSPRRLGMVQRPKPRSSARICKQAPGQIISSGRAEVAALAQMGRTGKGATLSSTAWGRNQTDLRGPGANGQRPNVW